MTPELTAVPLLVFDFDGVLVDGMPEYWWAARSAAQRLEPGLELPEQVPADFSRLRPSIHKGWEMVLVAAELSLGDDQHPADSLIASRDYTAALEPALRRWGWTPDRLQRVLEEVRSEALVQERQAWLGRHRFYPGVEARLKRLEADGADWAVLTTKGGVFASEILAAAGLSPYCLHGHEQGSKPEVLLQMRQIGRPLWFIEDRLPTLALVRANPGLEAVRCFLASWGYLAPGDRESLGELGIRWLTPERFAAPLAHWP